MAATTSRLSLEEFHRLYDGVKPNHEYWFGDAVPKSMATLPHSFWELILGMLLLRRGWKAGTEATVRISADLELLPDVIATRGVTDTAYLTEPVEICVEILSPDDLLRKTLDKGRHYLNWGVSYVWIIDPVERTARIQTAQHPDGIPIPSDGKLTAGEDTEIPLPELFGELDVLTGAVS